MNTHLFRLEFSNPEKMKDKSCHKTRFLNKTLSYSLRGCFICGKIWIISTNLNKHENVHDTLHC